MPWNGIFRVAFLCTRERIVRRPSQISIDATLRTELPFVFLIDEENRRFCLNRLKPLTSPQSSRRCDEGDGNENGENAIGLVSKTTTLHVYHAFSYNSLPNCTTSTWKCLISRFIEDVNKRRRIFLSLPRLECSPQEDNSTEIRLHLTFLANWNKCDKVWKKLEFILKVTFSLPSPSSVLKLPNLAFQVRTFIYR